MRAGWSNQQIDALRAKGGAEALILERLEAAALLYLDVRDSALCMMSANDGEWPTGSGISNKQNRRLKMLYALMLENARGCVAEENIYDLIWGVLDSTCQKHDYKAVVWGE